MFYEKHIPELNSGQTITIRRTVNNTATKNFVLRMFRTRAYYRLKDFKNAKIKTHNENWCADVRGHIKISINVNGSDIIYQEENLSRCL